MDRSVFENEITVVFVGQRFCVTLSAWLDGKGIAKLVSAGDGRGGENLFAMGMQLLQKLEFITEEVFFQKDILMENLFQLRLQRAFEFGKNAERSGERSRGRKNNKMPDASFGLDG